jgi:hypothetical protein
MEAQVYALLIILYMFISPLYFICLFLATYKLFHDGMMHAILFLLSYMQILRIFPKVACALIAL